MLRNIRVNVYDLNRQLCACLFFFMQASSLLWQWELKIGLQTYEKKVMVWNMLPCATNRANLSIDFAKRKVAV